LEKSVFLKLRRVSSVAGKSQRIKSFAVKLVVLRIMKVRCVMVAKRAKGVWIDALVSSIGDFVSIETTDGVMREGRLSGVVTKKFEMNDIIVELPSELELNGDPNDRIQISMLKKIEIN
jgi:hypothetical protein